MTDERKRAEQFLAENQEILDELGSRMFTFIESGDGESVALMLSALKALIEATKVHLQSKIAVADDGPTVN